MMKMISESAADLQSTTAALQHYLKIIFKTTQTPQNDSDNQTIVSLDHHSAVYFLQ